MRDWREDELDAMHRWLGDPRVTRFLSWGSSSRDDSALHLRECLADQRAADRRRYYLAMELLETQTLIGDAGFEWRIVDSLRREGALGYFLEPEYWGRGLATEAARLVLDFAFDRGATAMRASCDARNGASERVMQRAGMVLDPAGSSPARRVYALTRRAFEAHRSGA